MSPALREEALKIIRQWKRRQHLQACTLDVPPAVTAPLLHMGSVGPSEKRELYVDGKRTLYRVSRAGQWIALPVVGIQHQ